MVPRTRSRIERDGRTLPSDPRPETYERDGGIVLIERDSVRDPCHVRRFPNGEIVSVVSHVVRQRFNPSGHRHGSSVDSDVRRVVHSIGRIVSARGISVSELAFDERASGIREIESVLFGKRVHRIEPYEVRVRIKRSAYHASRTDVSEFPRKVQLAVFHQLRRERTFHYSKGKKLVGCLNKWFHCAIVASGNALSNSQKS